MMYVIRMVYQLSSVFYKVTFRKQDLDRFRVAADNVQTVVTSACLVRGPFCETHNAPSCGRIATRQRRRRNSDQELPQR